MQQCSRCCRPTGDVYMCLALLAWLMHGVEVGSPQIAGACIWLLQTVQRIAPSVSTESMCWCQWLHAACLCIYSCMLRVRHVSWGCSLI